MTFARQGQAVAGRPHGRRAGKQVVGRGTAKMKAAADKTLEEHSGEIAEALLSSLRGGNASCAKLLFALAEGQIDCEDEAVVGHFFSLAEKLASEEQWSGTGSEEEDETGFGHREPMG